MIKIILGSMFFLLIGCEDNTVAYSEMEEIDGNVYRIRAWGTDIRIYEWTNNHGHECTFAAGSRNGGISCVK